MVWRVRREGVSFYSVWRWPWRGDELIDDDASTGAPGHWRWRTRIGDVLAVTQRLTALKMRHMRGREGDGSLQYRGGRRRRGRGARRSRGPMAVSGRLTVAS
jgi:hypothetical protein